MNFWEFPIFSKIDKNIDSRDWKKTRQIDTCIGVGTKISQQKHDQDTKVPNPSKRLAILFWYNFISKFFI